METCLINVACVVYATAYAQENINCVIPFVADLIQQVQT